MELDDFLSRLEGVRHQPSGISARCPAHDDHVSSLTVNAGRDGGIVTYCHAECSTENVVAALGLRMRDLQGAPHITDVYVYTDDAGNPLYEIRRWANPKRFELVPPGILPANRVLYRSDALAWARERGAVVYVVEGEKDANRLADLGLVSTTNPFGAGSWEAHYAAQLAGCQVVIVADNDQAGRNHARDVAAAVRPVAVSVAVMRPRYGTDVSEMLDLGWTLDSLEPLPESDQLGMIAAVDILVRPIRWAWPGYFALGKVGMLEGDPGDGKSILTVDLVCRWTSGVAMPDGQNHNGPWTCVMINAEDDPEDTVVPRLMAGGADLSLVRFVDHGSNADQPFNISTDTKMLAHQVLTMGAKIVVIDPLAAFLGDSVDSHNDASVRQGLWPLYRMARDTGAAVVVVRHLNKGQGGKAIYRGGGSIGFGGAARSVFAVGRDPENPDHRVMACTKINIAPTPPALAYSILDGVKGPFLEWHGAVEASVQDVLDGAVYPKAAEIVEFLDSVVENGQPVPWSVIVAAGREEGYTEKQLRGHRGASRLIQIIGDSGRRSAKWGYSEHLAVDSHVPSGGPSDATDPHAPIFPRGGTRAHGAHVPSRQAQKLGHMGEHGAHGVTWKDEEDSEDDRRDAELDSLPAVCQICGTEESVLKWAKPYWLVRCVNHSPLTYGAGS